MLRSGKFSNWRKVETEKFSNKDTTEIVLVSIFFGVWVIIFWEVLKGMILLPSTANYTFAGLYFASILVLFAITVGLLSEVLSSKA
jgi:hypothetical protein